MRVLLVKTSSLGDVVHNLPVVTDIRRHVEGAQIDWVVEENFSAIPLLHPHVDRVIPVALRRWRKDWFNAVNRDQWRAFKSKLQERTYDFAIDTQGLLKSAMIVRAARGLRCGYDWQSAREPLASLAYRRKFNVAINLHAVERNRQLVASVLGYEANAEPIYGLPVPEAAPNKAFQAPYVVFLHATSRADKEWREDNWIALGKWFTEREITCILPSGNEVERQRAIRVAQKIPRAIALASGTLHDVAALLANAEAVVGVDTGLTHLACAFGKPTVAIYCDTDPARTGVYGSARAVNLGGIGLQPSIDAVLQAYARVGAR